MTSLPTPRGLGKGAAPLSRRRFLIVAAGGIAAAALVAGGMPVELAHSDGAALASRLKNLDQEAFVRYRGEAFHFSLPQALSVKLELVEVQDRASAGAVGGECFAVIFRGPQDRPLTQGTYEVWSRRSGAFSLFIVPMRPDGQTQHYEALFNRLPA
jgi:hypothetical protein